MAIWHGFTVRGIVGLGNLEIGRALCAARDKLNGHKPAFGRWREGRLPCLSRETALRFIQVFERFGSQHSMQHNVASNFLPTVLYALAAPSTPDSVDAIRLIAFAIKHHEQGKFMIINTLVLGDRLPDSPKELTSFPHY